MKTKILLAGLALFAFTSVGFAKDETKKADCPPKTECAGEKKACCGETAKADKAPAAKSTTAKKATPQPVAKK